MTTKGIGLLLSGLMVFGGWITMVIVSWERIQKERRMRKIEDVLPRWAQYLIGALVTLLIIWFLFVVWVTAADAQECTVLTVTDKTITDVTHAPDIQVAVVGEYLNFNIGVFDGPEGWEGFAAEDSVPLLAPSVEARVCPDGSVSQVPAAVQPVAGTIDLGDGRCQQTDGQQGAWNGTSSNDAGCLTEAEYAATFGEEALEEPVAATPELEPDAPTVREYLFSWIRPEGSTGGPQEF
jgi:hypothetical protein